MHEFAHNRADHGFLREAGQRQAITKGFQSDVVSPRDQARHVQRIAQRFVPLAINASRIIQSFDYVTGCGAWYKRARSGRRL